MIDINKIKKGIKDNAKIDVIPQTQKGGQQCGIIYPKVSLFSEDLDLKIETGYYRSIYQNKKLLLHLLDKITDELLK